MKDKILVVDFWHTGRESDRMVRLEDYLKLSAENAKLRELARMVENNSLMPHKHDDYYTRLCCLSERASEVLKELDKE